jgi:hypothetical protein
MPRNPTRREKLRAMAGQSASPNEALVAQAMLDRMPATLVSIAEQIKAEWGKGTDAQFAIGRLLVEARGQFPADELFGKWFAAQDFGFSRQVAWRLRAAAEREAEVRAFIAARTDSYKSRTKDLTVHTAITLMNAKPKPTAALVGPTADTDQDYAALRNAHNRILVVIEGEPTGNKFKTMHAEDLRKSALLLRDLLDAYKAAYNERQTAS